MYLWQITILWIPENAKKPLLRAAIQLNFEHGKVGPAKLATDGLGFLLAKARNHLTFQGNTGMMGFAEGMYL